MATPTLTSEHEHTGRGHDVVPLIVSADSKAGLRSKAHRLARYLADHPDTPFGSFARSVAADDTGRAHRAVLLAGDRADGRRGLESLAAGQHPPGVVRGSARRAERVVFVFPGQGSQWPGMALDLLEWSPVFAAELARCNAALARFADWSIVDVLRGRPGAPTIEDGADVVQPVLFAVMVALAALWRAHGVEPAAVVGHSLGEVAAACATGALSHEDGMRVAALWSSAQATLSGRGDMISVPLPVAEVRRRLAGRAGLDIGAVNAPTWVVVSGDSAAVEELLADLTAEGVRARRIPVGLAAHSRHIDGIRDRLLADLAPLTPSSTVVPFHSTVTEGPLDTAALDAGYWFRNLRNPVRFDEATRGLEVAVHGALKRPTKRRCFISSYFWSSEPSASRAPSTCWCRRHPINSALSLIAVMASLAVEYLLLGAEFVAAVQVIIYAGAIMVLFVFVIMLLNAGDRRTDPGSRVAMIFGVPGMLVGSVLMAWVLLTRPVRARSRRRSAGRSARPWPGCCSTTSCCRLKSHRFWC